MPATSASLCFLLIASARDSGKAAMNGKERRIIGTLTQNANQTFLSMIAAPMGGDKNSVTSSAPFTR